MKELNAIIAENIVSLRKSKGLTQLQLAEQLNYSDKAVSKWERGESLPDISVIKQIADFFSVSVDYLLTEEHSAFHRHRREYSARQKHNRRIITFISVALVWFLATFAFLNVELLERNGIFAHWLVFVYAIPISSVVLLVFNSIWGSPRKNFIIISLLVWSTLASIFLTCAVYNSYIWQLFILGVPAQAIICLWSYIKKKQ